MGFSYKPLFRLLLEKDIKKTDLKERMGLSRPTIAKFSRGEPVDGKVILKLCEYFHCRPGDIFEYTESEISENPPLAAKNTPEPVKIESSAPPTRTETPKPEPGTHKALPSAIDELRAQGKTALEVYEEVRAKARGPESDGDQALRESHYAEYGKELEESLELQRKLAEDRGNLLRERAERAPR